MIPPQFKYLKFCRVKKKSKAPFEKDWNNKPYSYKDISKFFPDENYGVICGYENLAVIDCDEEVLALAIESLFPETFTVKTGSGGKHFYFFIPDLKQKIILNADDKHLGEIQSHGTQVIGPGSIHPSGDEYEIIKNVGIKDIKFKFIEDMLGNFMKRNELVVFGKKEDVTDYKGLINEIVGKWKEGDRQELALSVAGYLRKGKGLGIDKVKQIITEVCKTTEDEEVAMRLRAVDETFKKDEKDIRGFMGLKKLNLKKAEQGELKKVITSFFDKKDLAKKFLEIQPLYYDKNKIWWMWDYERWGWDRVDETDILNLIAEISTSNTINAKARNESLEALRQASRKKKPEEIKESWVQFGDRIFDLNSDEVLEATSNYFVTNCITWNMHEESETKLFDELFVSWVGEEHIEELYELLAFCTVPSYFINRLFCLIGSGANGKSTFLKILERFIGEDNITSSSLYLLLKQRFEGSKLLKRLVCIMGETNFDLISNTDYLKKLTGEDLVRAEFKGKDGFDFRNYAKLVMATNSLPPTADKTEGFYRRWKILKFPNKFTKEKDVLFEIPDSEYEKLATRCFKIAKRLWSKREFTNDGDFEERKLRYEEESNPLMKLIKEEYERDIQREVLFQDFYDTLNAYLEERGHRALSAIVVSKQLKAEGFEVKHTTVKGINAKYILGIKLKGKESNQITL